MGRMLLAAAATWLLLTSALQVPPLASEAFIPRPPPKIGSLFLKPARAQKIGQSIKGFLKKHGEDIFDIIAQSLSPTPGDSTGSGGRSSSTSAGGAPATTAGLYVADLQVGTPPQNISGVLDITSELVWMQCSTCTDYCLPPPASSFNPTHSSTAQPLPCNNSTCQTLLPQTCSTTDNSNQQLLCGYFAEYYGGSNNDTTQGYFVFDTFTFDTTAVDDMLFGCSDSSTGNYSGASGVIGLGRGELSLVSQLGISNFSYFLAPNGSTGSGGESDNQFQLGGVAVPPTGSSTTPLYNSSAYPDLYYVGLTGVYVDGEEVAGIPAGTFDLQSNGSGGVFLSTTMSVTYLLSDAYTLVREAFASKISAQPYSMGSLDPLCYVNSSVSVPKLTLAFDGDVKMELNTDNYFFEYNDGESEIQCLTVLPSVGASVLGSLLQTGTTMIYDLERGQLTFVVSHSLASEAPAASLAMAVAVAVWVVRLLI
ncbi:hypothetical protein HU200_067298 [Digitaria exilis]|uniref:Peptidase A1 domain-containing protein n=1 Tax=Digitaria exilis TaxID=1010633 RepID=A0A835A5H6_9POAL|nr:hypothetical protein HU200_067298 [Digitaria exilis]